VLEPPVPDAGSVELVPSTLTGSFAIVTGTASAIGSWVPEATPSEPLVDSVPPVDAGAAPDPVVTEPGVPPPA
jgi:hypothetical protein